MNDEMDRQGSAVVVPPPVGSERHSWDLVEGGENRVPGPLLVVAIRMLEGLEKQDLTLVFRGKRMDRRSHRHGVAAEDLLGDEVPIDEPLNRLADFGDRERVVSTHRRIILDRIEIQVVYVPRRNDGPNIRVPKRGADVAASEAAHVKLHRSRGDLRQASSFDEDRLVYELPDRWLGESSS